MSMTLPLTAIFSITEPDRICGNAVPDTHIHWLHQCQLAERLFEEYEQGTNPHAILRRAAMPSCEEVT